MGIAISGSHAAGTLTLAAELANRLTCYTTIDEPCYLAIFCSHSITALSSAIR